MAYRRKTSSRRDFLINCAAGASLSLLPSPFIRKATAAERIVVVGYGGSYGDFVKEEFIKPFTAETGISVDMVTTPDLAKVKAQITSRNIEWDVFDGSGSVIAAGAREGLWEPIDKGIVDTSKLAIPATADSLPTFIFSGGVAWDPAKYPKPARSFSEFWDVNAFPGRRALRTRVSETIEMALLADGVKPRELYPLDLDRGFATLERIKKHVQKWFEQTTQMITLVQTNETDLIYAYANRVKAAKMAGVSIDFSFDQTINAVNYYAVLKGAPRKAAAMRYLDFVTRTDRQAVMAEKLGLGPVAKDADALVSAEARKWLPNMNNPNSVFINDTYWAEKFVEVDRRFKEWILT
jgi:putative spermidine/putrescine transport system substrate-binding protein